MHITTIKVRGYHLDMYQHVNNARYLEFLEEARWQYVESKLDLGDWMKKGYGFVVANININYRRPATLNAVLEIQSSMAGINQRSATIQQKIIVENTDTVIADARVTFVIIDMKTNQVLPIKDDLRELLETF